MTCLTTDESTWAEADYFSTQTYVFITIVEVVVLLTLLDSIESFNWKIAVALNATGILCPIFTLEISFFWSIVDRSFIGWSFFAAVRSFSGRRALTNKHMPKMQETCKLHGSLKSFVRYNMWFQNWLIGFWSSLYILFCPERNWSFELRMKQGFHVRQCHEYTAYCYKNFEYLAGWSVTYDGHPWRCVGFLSLKKGEYSREVSHIGVLIWSQKFSYRARWRQFGTMTKRWCAILFTFWTKDFCRVERFCPVFVGIRIRRLGSCYIPECFFSDFNHFSPSCPVFKHHWT